MVIDKNGFLIVVMVSTACINDGKVARLLARFVKELCCSIKVILADAGTDKIKKAFGYILDI